MKTALIHVLRETRAGITTLDDASAALGADPEVGLTEAGARDLLTKPSAEVEQSYRTILAHAFHNNR